MHANLYEKIFVPAQANTYEEFVVGLAASGVQVPGGGGEGGSVGLADFFTLPFCGSVYMNL